MKLKKTFQFDTGNQRFPVRHEKVSNTKNVSKMKIKSTIIVLLLLCVLLPSAFAALGDFKDSIGFAEKVSNAIATIFSKLGAAMDAVSLWFIFISIWAVVLLFFVLVIFILYLPAQYVYPWYRRFMFMINDFMSRL